VLLHAPTGQVFHHGQTGAVAGASGQIVPAPALILDPLMGSGTTGVACCTQRRQFIVIEREAHYFSIAQQRLVEVGKGKSICRLVDHTSRKHAAAVSTA
jgi:hypothetical protein